jgi:hypothetical protein
MEILVKKLVYDSIPSTTKEKNKKEPNKTSKKSKLVYWGWGHGPSGRYLLSKHEALSAKPQYCQTNKTKQKKPWYMKK